MAKYNGEKCISCGKVFKESDDVVVCPECGTPYHRDCYLAEGKCINTELHENGQTWKPGTGENSSDNNDDNDPIRCIRCGETNPADGIFCKKCGMPLTRNSAEERPFNVPPNYQQGGFNQNNQANFGGQGNPYGYNRGASPFGMGQQVMLDQDSDIDGVKLGDYAKYVGKNPLVMLSNFIRFGKFGGKTSLNIGALIFPQFYFFYRKMPLIGVILMLVSVVTSIPRLIVYGQSDVMGMVLLSTGIDTDSQMFNALFNFSSLIGMGVQFLSALFANFWYYKTAKRNIEKIRADYGQSEDEQTIKQRIEVRGGVSIPALIMSVTVYFALNTLIILLLNKFA